MIYAAKKWTESPAKTLDVTPPTTPAYSSIHGFLLRYLDLIVSATQSIQDEEHIPWEAASPRDQRR
jgi:hypothetical protein